MITGINHITISVESIDRAFAFYNDVLKLKPVMKSSIGAYFTAGDTWIALVKDKAFQQSENYTHIAFSADEKTLAYYRDLVNSGTVRMWQENKTEGESIYLLDDSGNKLEIHNSALENRIVEGKQHWGPDVEWFV